MILLSTKTTRNIHPSPNVWRFSCKLQRNSEIVRHTRFLQRHIRFTPSYFVHQLIRSRKTKYSLLQQNPTCVPRCNISMTHIKYDSYNLRLLLPHLKKKTIEVWSLTSQTVDGSFAQLPQSVVYVKQQTWVAACNMRWGVVQATNNKIKQLSGMWRRVVIIITVRSSNPTNLTYNTLWKPVQIIC
jgi:hypothetical protein